VGTALHIPKNAEADSEIVAIDEEVHDVRCIYRDGFPAHRIPAGANEAQIGDAAFVRDWRAASAAAVAPVARADLWAARSSPRSELLSWSIAGRARLTRRDSSETDQVGQGDFGPWIGVGIIEKEHSKPVGTLLRVCYPANVAAMTPSIDTQAVRDYFA
jgi:hypothetical protein